jgi:hypothetical protein
VADDDLLAIGEARRRAADPIAARRTAVGIGEQHVRVLRRADPHPQGDLLAVAELLIRLDVHHAQPLESRLHPLQDLAGVVLAPIVHHHHFEVLVVLVHQHGDQLLQLPRLVAGADHHAHRERPDRFHARLLEGQAAEDHPVEEHQHANGTQQAEEQDLV